ncbi:MAG: SDR family oxidoreductase [Hungatella sp.]|nr:SDR family oxidoreductase [Hungatella sp.]
MLHRLYEENCVKAYLLAQKQIAGSASDRILTVPCDVMSEASVSIAIDRILSLWNHIDVLINSAGCSPPYPGKKRPLFRLQIRCQRPDINPD